MDHKGRMEKENKNVGAERCETVILCTQIKTNIWGNDGQS